MPTEYVILRGVNDNGWIEERKITAASAKAAIRATMKNDTGTGRFVAVPARSWQPVTVTVETKTQLKFQ